jgi:hypothetical protein
MSVDNATRTPTRSVDANITLEPHRSGGLRAKWYCELQTWQFVSKLQRGQVPWFSRGLFGVFVD